MKNPLGEAGENYLEAILNLEDVEGNVRSVDVARELEVSRPSVNKAIGVLKDRGLVDQEPYGAIRLTERGRKRAKGVAHRHEILHTFLTQVLEVNHSVADEDACRMEHVVSDETLEKLTTYLEGHTQR